MDEGHLLKEAMEKYFVTTDTPSPVQIRYRPPFLRTNRHDARGDAMSIVFEQMVQRKVPLWAIYILAREFVNTHAEKLKTEHVKYAEDEYEEINASKWCKDIVECLGEFVRKYSNGTRELPAFPKEWKQLPISCSAQKNRKPKMEDAKIILPTFAVFGNEAKEGMSSDAFFAVMDGHHGDECAVYASTHFIECLFESLAESSNMIDTLVDTFDRMDKRITARCKKEVQFSNIKSGCTASCVYLKNGKTAYLAWCGDSAIGILRKSGVDTLTIPHKPEDPGELKRIEAAGGLVVSVEGVSRLNGVLNLSRSLGDVGAKPMISPKPDTLTRSISEDDYILFLSTDGVWDTLEEDEVYEAVRAFISNRPPGDFDKLAEFIVNEAKEAGASDNLTLLCVYLKPIVELWEAFSPS